MSTSRSTETAKEVTSRDRSLIRISQSASRAESSIIGISVWTMLQLAGSIRSFSLMSFWSEEHL